MVTSQMGHVQRNPRSLVSVVAVSGTASMQKRSSSAPPSAASAAPVSVFTAASEVSALPTEEAASSSVLSLASKSSDLTMGGGSPRSFFTASPLSISAAANALWKEAAKRGVARPPRRRRRRLATISFAFGDVLYRTCACCRTYRTTVGTMSYVCLWTVASAQVRSTRCGSIDSACGRLEPASDRCVWCPGDVSSKRRTILILHL